MLQKNVFYAAFCSLLPNPHARALAETMGYYFQITK